MRSLLHSLFVFSLCLLLLFAASFASVFSISASAKSAEFGDRPAQVAMSAALPSAKLLETITVCPVVFSLIETSQPLGRYYLTAAPLSAPLNTTTEYRSRYGGLLGRSVNTKATTELRSNTGTLLQRSTTTAKFRGRVPLSPGVIQPLRK